MTAPENSSHIGRLLHQAENRLKSLQAPENGGLFASCGPGFECAIFGRDSIEVAEDLLLSKPELSKEALLALARLQGKDNNDTTEEELGKIHHEYRVRRLGNFAVTKSALANIDRLAAKWGGTRERLCYYGSIDSTPLFVRLAGKYVAKYGDNIFDEKVTDDFGNEATFIDCLRSSARWVKNRVEHSPWKMLEFRRSNPNGLPYQAWKDSATAYMHEDGSLAEPDRGIASIEVQGYAYDALLTADRLRLLPKGSDDLQQLAGELQQNTLKYLWMDDKRYFAMGLDRDPNNSLRQIKTLSSNAAALLDSNLLVNLPKTERKKYVEPIVRRIMSEDFLTEAGIRSRARKYIGLVDNIGYHGSFVTWPKDTYDIAKGLRKHGYHREAERLEDILLDTAMKSKDFYEYYFVDESGKAIYDYSNEQARLTLASAGIPSTPEPGQAWTVTAIFEIAERRRNMQKTGNIYTNSKEPI